MVMVAYLVLIVEVEEAAFVDCCEDPFLRLLLVEVSLSAIYPLQKCKDHHMTRRMGNSKQ